MSNLSPKREKFCLAYLATGNACEAYRQSRDCEGMSQRTVEKRASELLKTGEVQGRLDQLRADAASHAGLSRAWVLERLMRNARIAMGEERIKIAIRPKGRDETMELEVTDRDGAAANRALEMLGKLPEVNLEVLPKQSDAAEPMTPTAEWLQKVRAGSNVVAFDRRSAVAKAEIEPEPPEATPEPPAPKPTPARVTPELPREPKPLPDWLPPERKREGEG